MPWSRFSNSSTNILNISSTNILVPYTQFHYSTKTRFSSVDYSVTSVGTNSRWQVWHTNWVGARTNATGFEIWYQVNGGSFSCLGPNGTFTNTTLWDTGSTDLWASLTAQQSDTITAPAGATINFTIYILSAGPGGQVATGTTDAIGHGNNYCNWCVIEMTP